MYIGLCAVAKDLSAVKHWNSGDEINKFTQTLIQMLSTDLFEVL